MTDLGSLFTLAIGVISSRIRLCSRMMKGGVAVKVGAEVGGYFVTEAVTEAAELTTDGVGGPGFALPIAEEWPVGVFFGIAPRKY